MVNESLNDSAEVIRHGLDMAEIFLIKNAHALNAPPVLSAIKEAQAVIAVMGDVNDTNVVSKDKLIDCIAEGLWNESTINCDVSFEEAKKIGGVWEGAVDSYRKSAKTAISIMRDMHKKPDNLNTSSEHAQGLDTSSTLIQKTAFEQLYKDVVGTKPMYTDPEHSGVIESDWFHKGIRYAQETLQQREIPVNAERQYPDFLSEDERKALLHKAEELWCVLEENNLGGFSGINRPFFILTEFKEVIEKYGRRDVGLTWSANDLRKAAPKTSTKIEVQEQRP